MENNVSIEQVKNELSQLQKTLSLLLEAKSFEYDVAANKNTATGLQLDQLRNRVSILELVNDQLGMAEDALLLY